MLEKPTHRLVKTPKITARDLADFMEASETVKRTIVRDCKYKRIARITQHNEAKQSIAQFLRDNPGDTSQLVDEAASIRARLADSDFDRDLYDHNADYIDRFASVQERLLMPVADRLPPGKAHALIAHDVKINPDLQLRFRRLTKTNKVRVGGVALRYTKGKPLSPDVANWQSAFLFGYFGQTSEEMAEPEHKLCLTIDAYAGIAYPAPTDAVRRFGYMMSACATIAERWPNIPPPDNAVF